jgi:hypothetical protein
MTRALAIAAATLYMAWATGAAASDASASEEAVPAEASEQDASAAPQGSPETPLTPAPDSAADNQALGQAANDPTASLASLQVADWYNASLHGLSGESANTVVLRPVIPFRTGPLDHILRVTAPFITDHPTLDSGLSDLTVFDLVVFNEKWGRWGVGPVLLAPTGGSHRGAEQWAIGPALGFVSKHGPLLAGLFNQNLFTFAGDDDRPDVDLSILQPILNYSLGGGWAIGASEMTFTYDWNASDWTNLPLGISVSKVFRVGKVPLQLNGQFEHNFAKNRGAPNNTARLTLKILFPR